MAAGVIDLLHTGRQVSVVCTVQRVMIPTQQGTVKQTFWDACFLGQGRISVGVCGECDIGMHEGFGALVGVTGLPHPGRQVCVVSSQLSAVHSQTSSLA